MTMNSHVMKILTRAGELYSEIDPAELGVILENGDRVVEDGNVVAQTEWTYRFLLQRYREFEKDPMMGRLYGPKLRADVILALASPQWRQRFQWESWFMAEYYLARFWRPDVIQADPKAPPVQPADPRNWWPMGLPDDVVDQMRAEMEKREIQGRVVA